VWFRYRKALRETGSKAQGNTGNGGVNRLGIPGYFVSLKIISHIFHLIVLQGFLLDDSR
jgi:hypothetical protein